MGLDWLAGYSVKKSARLSSRIVVEGVLKLILAGRRLVGNRIRILVGDRMGSDGRNQKSIPRQQNPGFQCLKFKAVLLPCRAVQSACASLLGAEEFHIPDKTRQQISRKFLQTPCFQEFISCPLPQRIGRHPARYPSAKRPAAA
jgi:hypothetical protein